MWIFSTILVILASICTPGISKEALESELSDAQLSAKTVTQNGKESRSFVGVRLREQAHGFMSQAKGEPNIARNVGEGIFATNDAVIQPSNSESTSTVTTGSPVGSLVNRPTQAPTESSFLFILALAFHLCFMCL